MIQNLFLSVGAMKAGTTWLYAQLKDHPDIYFTPEKEIHYFANKVGIENQLNHKSRIEKLQAIMDKYNTGNVKFLAENIDKVYWYTLYAKQSNIDIEWYEGLFNLNKEKKYCADFSNLYCQMGDIGWNNVKNAAKNVKIIYTLREPIDRLWSHYKFHMKWTGREELTTTINFEEFKSIITNKAIWKNTEYSSNYKNILKNFNNDQFKLLYFDDIKNNPEKILEEIQDFLNIQKLELSKDKINQRVNATENFSIPNDWLNFLKEEIAPEEAKLKELGLWHPNWSF